MKTRTLVTVAALGVWLSSVGLDAQTHTFVPSVFHATLSASHPVAAKIRSGDRVVTSVLDDEGAGPDGMKAEGPYPHTGPFFVEGAEVGDLLVISIDRITPSRTTGHSTSMMTANSIDPGSITSRPDPTRFVWTLDAARGVARLELGIFRGVDWAARFVDPAIELPLSPSLGSIGVAPADPGMAGGALSGVHGGNMVSGAVTAGTRVMLEVRQPGGLLFLGHGLARKGDGLVTGTGIETSLEVEFSVEVVKKQEWPHSSDVRPSTVVGEFPQGWPRLENAVAITTVATAPDLLRALQHATIELHHWLDDDFGLNEKSVSIIVGQAIEYEVARVGESSFTVAARLKKAYLPEPVKK